MLKCHSPLGEKCLSSSGRLLLFSECHRFIVRSTKYNSDHWEPASCGPDIKYTVPESRHAPVRWKEGGRGLETSHLLWGEAIHPQSTTWRWDIHCMTTGTLWLLLTPFLHHTCWSGSARFDTVRSGFCTSITPAWRWVLNQWSSCFDPLSTIEESPLTKWIHWLSYKHVSLPVTSSQ